MNRQQMLLISFQSSIKIAQRDKMFPILVKQRSCKRQERWLLFFKDSVHDYALPFCMLKICHKFT